MNRKRVGILGGGQLGLMLAEAALNLELLPVVFCSQKNEPAIAIAKESIIADPQDLEAIIEFSDLVDVIAVESEFFPFPDILDDSHAGKIFPKLATLRVLSDKLQQKILWQKNSLPTSPFIPLGEKENLNTWIHSLESHFPDGFVIKTAKNGYDGKGVLVCDKYSETISQFCEESLKKGGTLYCERKINFKRELAIIGCRSINGEFASYPLVISEQTNGVCYLVQGPACSLDIPKEVEVRATQIAKNIAEIADIRGAFGVEFFETSNGELLINEIAPRVHNSGHYSQDASITSQFENHWRALLGMPLGSTESKGVFAMLNLLGPADVFCHDSISKRPTAPNGTKLHWYGKTEIKPGRKLGHINGVVDNKEKLADLLVTLKRCERNWINQLKEDDEKEES
jgi:5-(carboxyamino)imidazole ribonucleotide synthase